MSINILTWTCPCGKKNAYNLSEHTFLKRLQIELSFDEKLCPDCFEKSLKNKGGLNA